MPYLHLPRSIGSNVPRWPFTLNRDSPQAQGLVAWWPVVLGNGLVDLSGNNHNAALTAVTLQPSKFGNIATQYDGANSFAQVPAGSGSVFEPVQDLFTITCWIDSFAAEGEGNEAIFDASGSGGDDGYFLFISDTTDSLRFNMKTGSGATAGVDSGFDPRGAGPTHVACIRTGLKSAKMIINGSIEATDSHASAPTFLNISTDLFFGQDNAAGVRFEGQIFDIRYYTRALTNAEILHQFNPATRWDLYRETSRASHFFVPAGAVASISDYRFRQRYFG